MKKFINVTTFVVILSMFATMSFGCSEKSDNEDIIDESIVTEVTTEESKLEPTFAEETTTEAVAAETTTTEATTVEETTTEATTAAVADAKLITDEMALDAIHDRCVLENPDNVELGGDHWIVESSDDNQVVVLFIAYTGAEIRYYVDRVTGDTYVTEFVSGIMDEEQMSDVTLNAREHIALEIYG